MPAEIFLHTLKDLRRGAFKLGAALMLYALVVMGAFPAVSGGAPSWLSSLLAALSGVPAPAASAAAWLNAAGFSTAFPLALCAFAAWAGSALIAGEERSGTLELLLAYPLPRWRLMLEKFAALAAVVALLAVGLWAVLALSTASMALDLTLGHLAGACLALGLLALAFGGLAFVVSALTGSPTRSRLVALGALAAAYILGAAWVHGVGFLRYLSPFYYATGRDPLSNGLLPGHALLLALLVVVSVAAAGAGFERRDLAV